MRKGGLGSISEEVEEGMEHDGTNAAAFQAVVKAFQQTGQEGSVSLSRTPGVSRYIGLQPSMAWEV